MSSKDKVSIYIEEAEREILRDSSAAVYYTLRAIFLLLEQLGKDIEFIKESVNEERISKENYYRKNLQEGADLGSNKKKLVRVSKEN